MVVGSLSVISLRESGGFLFGEEYAVDQLISSFPACLVGFVCLFLISIFNSAYSTQERFLHLKLKTS